ncbi:MAG TPA: hypothetical protein VMB34_25305 [Acetobacteraceae bacterium]|nr:hypothetical protein [Acetobacteraceae bacterium]
MHRSLLALVALLPLAGPAAARPIDGPLQQQLLALFYRYNRAIEAGDLNQALAQRSDAEQAALRQQLATPKDRADFLNASREMVPDRLEPMHASMNDAGDKALLIMLASKTVAGHVEQQEFDLGFVSQGGVWKLGELTAGPGPADLKRCNQSYQPISAYQDGQPVTLAGRIERVEFLPDHTLVLLSAGPTEVCAFLPNRAALQQHGLDAAIIQPWRIAEISGVAEKADPQKVMVNNITVHREE